MSAKEAGVYACGDLLVEQPGGETYWFRAWVDEGAGTAEVIRSCWCGGWFTAGMARFQHAPPEQAVPVPQSLCLP